MRLVDGWYLNLEWPDPYGAKHARAKLVLFLSDRFAVSTIGDRRGNRFGFASAVGNDP